MSEWRLILSDGFAIVGAIAITLAVIGVIRIPDAHAKIHAAAKGVTLGVLVVLGAALVASPLDVIVRAILVGVFLQITSPVGAHALAKLAAQLSDNIDVNSPQVTSDSPGQDST